mmetsp:Transcript_14320/g.40901  ORF Transcript_14320/g.40901 Transcript_14320/m.40901 type:complete len:320 (-) Transcript_14320:929-1888(-)
MVAQALLGEPSPEAEREELTRVLPRDDAPDDALGLHPHRRVVHGSKRLGDAGVDGEELGLPLLDELVVDAVICHQLHHNGVDPVHGRDQLLGPELDLHHALGLQDASLPGRVSVALDLVRVDLRVDDDPGSATKLASRRDVHEHRMAVGAEVLDDERSGLEDPLEEVALASTEAPPVGHNKHREAFQVKLLHGVGGLQGRIREPDLASLGDGLLRGVGHAWVGRDVQHDRVDLDGDDSARNAAQASTPSNDGPCPSRLRFHPRSAVKHARGPVTIHDGSGNGHPGVELPGASRHVGHLPGDIIGSHKSRHLLSRAARDE